MIIAKQVPWNNILLEEFIKIGGLSEDEEKVLRTRVAGWSIVKQSAELGLSVSTINRIVKRLKVKYDNVQMYSPLLPPRKFSVMETYFDIKLAQKRHKNGKK